MAEEVLAIVLAAGEGTRMKSARPKVLHEVAGLSMVGHAVKAAMGSGATRVAAVIGQDRADVSAEVRRMAPDAHIAVQEQRRGTAHAVLAARAAFEPAPSTVVVLFGDTPLVAPATIGRLIEARRQGNAVVALAFRPADPTGYGRIITEGGKVVAIREQKDANEAERAIRLCNAGLMALDGRLALSLLQAIGSGNAQGEFYLTDAVSVAHGRGLAVTVVEAPESEVMGVNDRVQLAAAEAVMQRRLADAAMRGGVTLLDPASTFLSHDTVFGRDVTIEPNVFIGKGVAIEDDVVVHASSHLEGCRIGTGAQVGPFARVRPGTVIGARAKIGNFVEIKAAEIAEGAKVSHLSYIGDATVGREANIGAGTITCNYDGFLKHRTVIGDGAFIGSNSSLVAPISIGQGAYVASGSVVTRDVAKDALAIGRAPQVPDKPGWAERFRTAMAKVKARRSG
jgi:bifunctional UDP-N-acetylglucosamine pyrophosphorylase / glucosamine-1-phosphate N-acetyltransferase